MCISDHDHTTNVYGVSRRTGRRRYGILCIVVFVIQICSCIPPWKGVGHTIYVPGYNSTLVCLVWFFIVPPRHHNILGTLGYTPYMLYGRQYTARA